MICPDYPNPQFLIFSAKTPFLLYYSHLSAIIASLLIGLFVYLKNKNSQIAKVLLSLSIVFSLWSFFDLILWTNNESGRIIFFWSLFRILDVMFYILSLYFVYLFVDKKDISFRIKLFIGFFLLPIILFSPTKYNLNEFDLTVCGIFKEGIIYSYYAYFLELAITLWIIGLLIRRYHKASEYFRKQIVYLAIGIGFFLLSFFVASFLAQFLIDQGLASDFSLEQYGLFGMVVFMAFLAYLIVKFKAFNIKLLSTQALVFALIIFIGSLFLVQDMFTIRIITAITLALTIIAGWQLVRSVKLEVQRKEELESLSNQLAMANDKLHQLDKAKSEFISIASHQLRTPLTAIKGFVSLLLEGTYGEVAQTQRQALEKVYISNERLVQLVEDLLNVSRMEAGRMEFDFQEASIEDLIQEAVDTLELSAHQKDLYLHWQKPADTLPKLKIDITKIKEVISNMIDNAIKYTQRGGITVKVEKGSFYHHSDKEQKNVVRVIVSDTGIGMEKADIDMIFNKFQRGREVSHYHTDGTGLGMYIGKKVVEAHQGSIWAESEGKSKGSKFILELPIT
jgi:signal transduction histidine kinase